MGGGEGGAGEFLGNQNCRSPNTRNCSDGERERKLLLLKGCEINFLSVKGQLNRLQAEISKPHTIRLLFALGRQAETTRWYPVFTNNQEWL